MPRKRHSSSQTGETSAGGNVVLGQVIGVLLVRRLLQRLRVPQVGRQVAVGAADGRVGRLGYKCNNVET